MTDLSVSMPPALQNWVERQLAGGAYADASDYLRDLVRRDRDGAAMDHAWLKAMIDQGRVSGFLDEEPAAVVDAILAEDPEFRD